MTLCDPVDCSTPGSSVLYCLLEFDQIPVCWVGDSIQPCHPLLSPSPSAFNLYQSFPFSLQNSNYTYVGFINIVPIDCCDFSFFFQCLSVSIFTKNNLYWIIFKFADSFYWQLHSATESESEVAQLCLTLCNPRTVACQAPLSMGFSRQEYWSGLPFPSPGIFLTQGSNPGLPHCRQTLYPLSHQGNPHSAIKPYLIMFKFQVLCSRIPFLFIFKCDFCANASYNSCFYKSFSDNLKYQDWFLLILFSLKGVNLPSSSYISGLYTKCCVV